MSAVRELVNVPQLAADVMEMSQEMEKSARQATEPNSSQSKNVFIKRWDKQSILEVASKSS